jgi:hypothetical protein
MFFLTCRIEALKMNDRTIEQGLFRGGHPREGEGEGRGQK